MNGICVIFRGWIDLERLDGVGSLEFDEERAAIEEAILKDESERHKAYMREVEQRNRLAERQAQAEAEVNLHFIPLSLSLPLASSTLSYLNETKSQRLLLLSLLILFFFFPFFVAHLHLTRVWVLLITETHRVSRDAS